MVQSLHRSGGKSSYAGLVLVLAGCMSTPDLEGGGLPLPYHRPPPHETTEAECYAMGREWVWNPQFAAGGYCKADDGNPWPPPILNLCPADAGVDAARPFCHGDAGADDTGADGG